MQNISNPEKIVAVFLHFLFAWQNKIYISDNVIACILSIIIYLVLSIASIFMLQPVKELASRFPGSLYKARILINLDKVFVLSRLWQILV